MKRLILGTAGHIDHGKTALIRALSGIDTDRLKEEKERGITIELGFAHLDLPSGTSLGIVDVPGHERFIRHMVAGAGGIDLVALVIAADEGIMPQTTEHLNILVLLGIRRGLVVITKIDLVEPEMVGLVREEVEEFTRGTFLEGCPIVEVSSTTGHGIDTLAKTLDRMVGSIEGRTPSGIFRLPIDRVFTMKGFGTVVTGTLMSGGVHTGEEVAVMPRGAVSRVRGIQVHGKAHNEATAGTRTAVNLTGIDTDQIARGDVLVSPGSVEPSYMIDARLTYLGDNTKPLRNRQQVKFHLGTSEIVGNVVLLDTDELTPGRETFVQIRLTQPAVALPGDRFVVRLLSPVITIGGGEVLNAVPKKHRRFREEVIEDISTLALGTEDERARVFLRDTGYVGATGRELARRMGIGQEVAAEILSRQEKAGSAVLVDKDKDRWLDAEAYGRLREILLSRVAEYHEKNPTEAGIPKEELPGRLPWGVEGRLFVKLLSDLAEKKKLSLLGDRVALFGREVRLAGRDEELMEKACASLIGAGLTPPTIGELAQEMEASEPEIKKLLSVAARGGRVVRVKEGLYFGSKTLADLKARLVAHLKEKEKITTQEFKEITGASRKYTIPLLEYFDDQRVTIRVGEVRKLRERSGG